MLKKIGLVLLAFFLFNTFVLSAPAKTEIPKPILELLQKPKEETLQISGHFMALDGWISLANALRGTDLDKITLLIQGYGGIATEGNTLIRAVEDARDRGKIVNMEIIGPV